MAKEGQWINALLNQLNAPVTPRNRAMLSSWQRWEGGHTKNTARFNWLNTSRKGYGGRSAGISGVSHIKAYPDFERGVQATAETIKWGYPNLLAGIRSGGPSLQDPGVQGDLNRWLTGKRQPGMTAYVRKIASSLGDVPPAAEPVTAPTKTGVRTGALAQAAVPSAVPKAQLKRTVKRTVSKEALLGELMKATQMGEYSGFLNKLVEYKNPEVKTQILIPNPRREVIKPTAVPTPRGTKRDPTVSVDHTEPIDPRVAPTIKLARQYLGQPYVHGGASPRTGFDCSGFVQWLMGQRGITTGRTTWDQVTHGRPVARSQLQPGDAIFFNTEGVDSHEGMYIGSGQFIHSPHTGDVIKISSLNDSYYTSHYHTARRFLY